jgi:hypothetical protein
MKHPMRIAPDENLTSIIAGMLYPVSLSMGKGKVQLIKEDGNGS